MTEYLLSLDPGLTTGIALLSYDDDSAPVLEAAWQFGGGVAGLLDWIKDNNGYPTRDNNTLFFTGWDDDVTTISEKFTARNTRGFAYTTASLEPLRCEGALIALGLMPDYTPKEKRWRDPGLQYLAGGKDKADKKKRQHKFLKDNGYYRTGKDFGTADADDFRSACAHGINYLIREVKHKPSYQLVVDCLEKEGE